MREKRAKKWTQGIPPKDVWVGPDGTSGPGVPEDWYLSYDGPAPKVEAVYEDNYGVDEEMDPFLWTSTSTNGVSLRDLPNKGYLVGSINILNYWDLQSNDHD